MSEISSGILVCEQLMNTRQAVLLQEMIERETGRPCPCRVGQRCPLLPAAEGAAAEPGGPRRLAS